MPRKKKDQDANEAPKPIASFDAPDEAHWHRLISEKAYYIAEERGFAQGSEVADWLAAEELVKAQLQPG